MVKLIVKFCGFLGILGVFSAVITNFIGTILVRDHNPIKDTISQLAITELAWIQDVGLDAFAAGILGIAVGLYLVLKRSKKTMLACMLLVMVAIDIIVIAEHNKYAGRPEVKGADIHLYCVILLGFLLTSVFWLFKAHGQENYPQLRYWSTRAFWSWLVAAPIFFIVPNDIDGLYERILALIPLGWIVLISLILFKSGHKSSNTL